MISDIIRSLKSNGFYIADKRIVDISTIDSILSSSGLTQVIAKVELGDIVVYHIDVEKVKRACTYQVCSSSRSHDIDTCIRKCIISYEEKLIDKAVSILESIRES
ncbi:MAG: hypothetical protein QXO93_04925 [Acidilobaceae archaeon]